MPCEGRHGVRPLERSDTGMTAKASVGAPQQLNNDHFFCLLTISSRGRILDIITNKQTMAEHTRYLEDSTTGVFFARTPRCRALATPGVLFAIMSIHNLAESR